MLRAVAIDARGTALMRTKARPAVELQSGEAPMLHRESPAVGGAANGTTLVHTARSAAADRVNVGVDAYDKPLMRTKAGVASGPARTMPSATADNVEVGI